MRYLQTILANIIYIKNILADNIYITFYPIRNILAGVCGNMECDAQKRLMIIDFNGEFTGWNRASVYILPKSDMAWDTPGEEVRAIGDHLIPNAMQTDVDGNRIPMDQVRPNLGRYS